MKVRTASAVLHTPPRKGAAALGDFLPFESLWDEGGAGIFRSEQSARWFVRNHRPALVEGEAIAIHAGRMLVHPQRFSDVAMSVALRIAKESLKGEGAIVDGVPGAA